MRVIKFAAESMTLVKMLIVAGLALIAAGVAIYLVQRLGGSSWRMPGDIVVQRKNFTFYFPLVTSVVISLLLSFFFYLFQKYFNR